MRTWKWLFITAVAFVIGAALAHRLAISRTDPDPNEEEAVKSPSLVSVVKGQTVVTLSAAMQKRLGINVRALRPVNTYQKATALATVLSAQGLVSMRNAYVMEQAQLAKARATANATRQEYRRQHKLYAENQSVSLKSLQAEEAMLRVDQVQVAVLRQQLKIQELTAQQAWGSVVAGWLADDSASFSRLLSQRVWPVRVTLQSGRPFTDPPLVALSIPAGNTVDARYVSELPQVDPRIQGISLLYVAPARPGLAPGLNLVARFPVGARLKGVVAPLPAILWWRGQAWLYEQTSPTQFVRKLVPTNVPLRDGYFTAHGLAAGDRVVVSGAESLLAVEISATARPARAKGDEG